LRNAFSNADSNSNGYCDGDSNCDTHRDVDGDRNGHANSYRYGKTQSNPERPSDTEATTDPSASSVTGNTHEGFKAGQRRFNQEPKKAGVEEKVFEIEDKQQTTAGAERVSNAGISVLRKRGLPAS
jgi:hypothetical protein